MENRAHAEPLENRTARFENGSPVEIIETLLNSIDNYFNNEIRLTMQGDHFQTSLMFLGVHAAALTMAEGFFDAKGLAGYKLFLKNYVDGDSDDTKFSAIAESIHGWRNIIAHQWLGTSGYTIGYDYNQVEGWVEKDGVFYINPKIYAEHYLKAFSAGGIIWRYDSHFPADELEGIKRRLLDRFLTK